MASFFAANFVKFLAFSELCFHSENKDLRARWISGRKRKIRAERDQFNSRMSESFPTHAKMLERV